MDEWIDALATELGEDPLPRDEVVRLLGVARDVAHRVERKITPLASFLLGAAVGRAEAGGMARQRALDDAVGTLERLLPPEPPDRLESPAGSDVAGGGDVTDGGERPAGTGGDASG